MLVIDLVTYVPFWWADEEEVEEGVGASVGAKVELLLEEKLLWKKRLSQLGRNAAVIEVMLLVKAEEEELVGVLLLPSGGA